MITIVTAVAQTSAATLITMPAVAPPDNPLSGSAQSGRIALIGSEAVALGVSIPSALALRGFVALAVAL
jgi:hypothetical protein